MLENQEPENLPTDLETLTDEERFLFRRIGLSMKPYLLLGKTCILCFFAIIMECISISSFTLREARNF